MDPQVKNYYDKKSGMIKEKIIVKVKCKHCCRTVNKTSIRAHERSKYCTNERDFKTLCEYAAAFVENEDDAYNYY